MMFYIFAGLASALAILFLLAKFDFKKVLWNDISITLMSTILIVIMFYGKFAGKWAEIIGVCLI